ncbi:hypothetical protein M758_1G328200 [Ceratodon purpureus]|uniref:Uncharacterized protein n=1 Tax=Ceratodon purpureus TaxID=3225 RepID=A0A8T0JEV3_CERPU|nr:hypothetical protein KC19_1G335700 [Ceratodon purpureus]KAG0632430.1 hypothetical protein M758_1G328200 [Ceratodon purpureus]
MASSIAYDGPLLTFPSLATKSIHSPRYKTSRRSILRGFTRALGIPSSAPQRSTPSTAIQGCVRLPQKFEGNKTKPTQLWRYLHSPERLATDSRSLRLVCTHPL